MEVVQFLLGLTLVSILQLITSPIPVVVSYEILLSKDYITRCENSNSCCGIHLLNKTDDKNGFLLLDRDDLTSWKEVLKKLKDDNVIFQNAITISQQSVFRICRPNFGCANLTPDNRDTFSYQWSSSEELRSCQTTQLLNDECMRLYTKRNCEDSQTPYTPMLTTSLVFNPNSNDGKYASYVFNPNCSIVMSRKTPAGRTISKDFSFATAAKRLKGQNYYDNDGDPNFVDLFRAAVSTLLYEPLTVGESTCQCNEISSTPTSTTTTVPPTPQVTSTIDNKNPTSDPTTGLTTQSSLNSTTELQIKHQTKLPVVVQINPTENSTLIIVFSFCISSLPLAIILRLVVLILRRRREANDQTQCSFEFEIPENLKPSLAVEISRDDFSIHTNHILGEGEFGIVYRGGLKNNSGTEVEVAIKNLKKPYTIQNLTSLLNEIKVMHFVGKHPNIICLLGACSVNARKGELYSLVEFCTNGSLKEYLPKLHKEIQKNSPTIMIDLKLNSQSDGDYANPFSGQLCTNLFNSKEEELRRQLIKWSMEIASGMVFLGSKNVIHIDLAIRNVFLTGDLNIKIGDFGLSRKLYEILQYKKTTDDFMPWKWLSLESLTKQTYSVKSDVWSYGVTLWEMFNLGIEEPYSEIATPGGLILTLNNGDRLPRPKYADDDEFVVISKCWKLEPIRRPEFSWLEKYFTDKLQSFQPGTDPTRV